MEKKLNTRTRMICGTIFVIAVVSGALVGLTIGLYDQPPPYGGGPPPETPPEAPAAVYRPRHRRGAGLRDFPESGSVKTDHRPQRKDPGIDPSVAGAPFDSEYRTFSSAAVTTDTHNCSNVGVEIMRQGVGSVVDAAISTWLCVCVVNSHSCGLGGGHFATIYERPRGETEKVLMALVSRTRAPGAAYQDMFVNNTEASSFGGLAVAVPGDTRGYYEAWKVFGRLPWAALFEPAISRCEDGFIVEEDLAGAIKQYEDVMYSDPNFRELFVKEDGTLVQEGDLLKNPKLGATMRAIAADPFTFYNGSLAEDIVLDLAEYGSIITSEDLRNFESKLKTPVNVTLDNGRYKLFNPPPPSSGSVLDFIVNILDGYSFNPSSVADTDSKILTYHRIVEAFKFAYAKRSELGDEDFVDVTDLVYNLTSDSYAEEIRLQIDDSRTHDVEYYDPTFDMKPDSGTAHMNVLAPDGAAVAMSGTINLFFGAKVRGRRTGIIFNDDMDDFSTPGTFNYYGVPASPSNYIEPGKIPMSSMSPTLILNEDGSVVFMSGAAGGTRITTETSFLTMNSLWFDMDLSNATDTARIHHQLVPNELVYEPWLEQEVYRGLLAKNHTMVTSSGIAVVGSVRNRCLSPSKSSASGKADDCIEAVSDARKGGAPDGF